MGQLCLYEVVVFQQGVHTVVALLLAHVVQEEADDREDDRCERHVGIGRADDADDALGNVDAVLTQMIVVHVGGVNE